MALSDREMEWSEAALVPHVHVLDEVQENADERKKGHLKGIINIIGKVTTSS